jgi:hypothetical protein
VVAECLARKTADDHDDQSGQQQVGQVPLAARLPAGDEGRQEDAPREEGGRDDEERQLQVPGAAQVVGQHLRQVEAEEAAVVGVVMGRSPAEQGLHQEEGGHREEVPRRGALSRRQRHLVWRDEAEPALLHAVPTHQVGIAAVGRQHQPDAA